MIYHIPTHISFRLANILYIPLSFLVFHIPLIFALQQLKISEICTLFRPIKLQMFCILTIIISIWFRIKTYSVLSHSSKMELFTKILKAVNYCRKIPHIRCLTKFWIRLTETKQGTSLKWDLLFFFIWAIYGHKHYFLS